MSLRRGSSAPIAEGSDPPYGSETSPRPSRPPTRVEPIYRRGGVRGTHVSHRRRRGRESSAGRLAHPPHPMRVVEACSAAAARGAAFVRPHCRPHIIELHSAAACAASAQSPSAALNGYDGTTPFHHTAYAQATRPVQLRGSLRQATPQATPWRRFDKTGHGYAGRRFPTGRARKSRNEISVACNAIMYVQYVILYHIDWAHLSGIQRPCTRLP